MRSGTRTPTTTPTNDGYDIEDEHTFQVQIGSNIMPEYPLSSVTETLYQLGKTTTTTTTTNNDNDTHDQHNDNSNNNNNSHTATNNPKL